MHVGLLNKYVNKCLNIQGLEWEGKSFIYYMRCPKEIETLVVKGTKISL